MRNFLLLLLSVCLASHTLAGDAPVYIVHRKSGLCLGVGSDGATLQLLQCGENAEERWRLSLARGASAGYLMKSEKTASCIDSEKSNNGGVVQVFPCEEDSARQHIGFNSDGKITAGLKCLAAYNSGGVGDMLQFKHDCAEEWATTKHPAKANEPPSLDSPTPKAPPVTPVTPAVIPASSSGSSAASGGVVIDHYLCTCLERDSDDVECLQAVKAACVVGHIPAKDCAASFDNGDHEAVSKHVIALVKAGNECSKTVRGAVPQKKLVGLKGHALPSKDDHYLCVCLKNGGSPDDSACLSAVSAACLVGHIPVPACALSFEKSDHSHVINHVLRMIDNGANCKTHLDYTKLDKPYGSSSSSSSSSSDSSLISGQDHFMCVCLDDWASQACKDAVNRGCKLGHIPKKDCEVTWTGDFSKKVTKHVLHLVDHGVACSAHGAMHFTNNGCHCMQTWTSDDGVLMQFPNNCGDPRSAKGYGWCKTYESEGCKGAGNGWDRCDAPREPKRDVSFRQKGKAGQLTAADHYLCVCIDKDSTDEVCVAAAKAACAVGHLPSDACRASFERQDHIKVSQSIIDILSSAQCSGINKGSSSKAKPLAPPIGSSGESSKRLNACFHGTSKAEGGCSCDNGYAGSQCNQCASGFEGYPDCTKQTVCRTRCVHGSCDELTGKCVCPVNRVGDGCERCAPGMHGKECLPEGVVTSFDTFTTIKRLFLIILVIVGLSTACWWFYLKPMRLQKQRGYFDKVPNMEMSMDKTGGSSSGPSEPKNSIFNTGLAI